MCARLAGFGVAHLLDALGNFLGAKADFGHGVLDGQAAHDVAVVHLLVAREVLGDGLRRNVLQHHARAGELARFGAEAAQVAQAAQQYFAFESVNFSLSREAKQAMQHALTRLAVERVADRAVEVAKAMGKPASAVRIENLNFGHSGYVAPRMLRANKMMAVEGAAMSAAPVLEAGDTSVTLNVDAQVRID